MVNQYEAVFIMNPVLSDEQVKETVNKFEGLLKDRGAEIINAEYWGLKKLAYTIDKKKSGFYHFVEFRVEGSAIAPFEVEIRRDERVMRFLTVKMDKYGVEYADKRRKRVSNTKKQEAKS
jgi:small subunit ribosomal protein S6